MPTIVVKVAPDVDMYVGWSSVVDAPVWYGTRAEAIQALDVTEDRLRRADETGSSTLWEVPGYPREGTWEDAGFIYMQQGWLPRERLGALVAAIEAKPDDPDIAELLDPFDD